MAAVTAGAAASVGSNAALAADPVVGAEPEWFLSLEGGLLFADPAIDKVGGSSVPGFTIDFDDFDKELGYRGAAAFGKKFNDNLDWRLGVAYSDFVKNQASLFFSGGSGSSGIVGDFEGNANLSYLTGDLELGYNVRPGDDFDLRVFGGLRVLNSRDTQDKFGDITLGSSGGFIEQDVRSEFLGAGPRAGVDFSSRLGDGPVGFSGMLAAALIFGDLKQKVDVSFTSGGSSSGSSYSFHENETIFNLEAAFGTDFHLTDNAVLTIGYRGEYWNDIRFSDNSDKIGGGGTPDMLSHGPFLRFTTQF
jgi:opacity protein-like surface antigen